MAISINRKRIINDAIAGSISLAFTIGGFLLKSTVNWPIVIVFGICFILVLLKYIFPENKIFNPDGNKSDDEKRADFKNNNGIFEYDANGFNIKGKDFEQYISWYEISKITAYKQDLLAYDQIYITIEVNNNTLTIHEDTCGWYQFIKRMETKLPLKENWLKEVTFPPFEKNEIILFDKDTTATCSVK